jgi:hypothetical protein
MSSTTSRSRYCDKAPMQYSGSYQAWRAAMLRGDKPAALNHGRDQLAVAERARVEAFAFTYEAILSSPSRSRRHIAEMEQPYGRE